MSRFEPGSHASTHRKTYPDDAGSLPEGAVFDGARADRDVHEAADYVIVGSGAAGATAAEMLSSHGFSVALIEEGPWVRTREFSADVFPAMRSLFREVGTNMTLGPVMMPVLQGSCVGGSTTINSAIAWRAPEEVIDGWSRDYGLDGAITYRALESHYEELDRALTVRPVEDGTLGAHNTLFADAAAKLGVRAERIKRYDGGCVGSASCLTGCRSGKKLAMNLTYVPKSLRQGARIFVSTRAIRVEARYGRARAVIGAFKSPGAHLLRVEARRGVIAAASAVQTPGFLRRSGVRSRALGRHFQAHPGSSLIARFDRPVSMQAGATQGYNSTQFVGSDRFKIEALSFPPEMVAMRIPGLGPELVHDLLDYPYVLNWAVIQRSEAEGRVGSLLGKDLVRYCPTPADMTRMRKGLRLLSEMMFAAGAKEVWPAVYGIPKLRSADDLRLWDGAPIDPRAYGMMISHLFGSARMGKDPRSSVVGLDFQVHGVHGLYVLDSSVFPTNIGVNPQHTIMAVARMGALRIAERSR